jgi:uncharacterized protein YukE
VGQKFDMGSDTLSALRTKTSGSSDQLGATIKQLINAATPLEGRFNGAGKAAFDRFKLRSDEITAELNRSLSSILGGIGQMDTSFREGEQDMSTNAATTEGAANFEAARFGGNR